MLERVAVAVNGSAGSTAAIAWGTNRASTVPMRVELFTVIEREPVHASIPDEFIAAAHEHALEHAAVVFRQTAPDVSLTTSVRRGSTLRETTLASATADLLVIGTREPAGYFSGTLRHQVAAGTRCPVVIVPAKWQPTGGPIVVGIQNDETSLAALEFAATEAQRLQVELKVVLAWGLPVVLTTYWLAVGGDPSREIRRTHQRFLAEAARSIRASHPGLTVSETLEHGPAAVILSDIAENASLLVVGTHRREMIADLFLGSVAHDLLVSMPCPVALVPRPEIDESPA